MPLRHSLIRSAVSACALLLGAASAVSAQNAPGIPTAEDAPVALLVDRSSGQTLFAREENRRFAPASVTKVMTAYTAFRRIGDGTLRLDQVMAMQPGIFDEWSRVGSTMFLPHDARASVDQLLMGVTTVSANDGAAMLAAGAAGSVEAWVASMNDNARRLGMRDSHFGTPNGWPDGGATFTTARDLVTLASSMIGRYPQLYYRYFGRTSFTYNGITQRNHDPISGVVTGADGLKTGYTDQAGYTFLGSAERNGRRLIMVVAGSDTGRARERAARSLIEWGFAAFDHYRIVPAGRPVGYVEVQNGDRRSLPVVADGGLAVSVPRGTRPDVSMTIRYTGPLEAPLSRGATVARLHVSVAGQVSYTVPLRASVAVAEAGPFDRIRNGVAGWFS